MQNENIENMIMGNVDREEGSDYEDEEGTANKVPFLKKLTIQYTKIPVYADFNSTFKIKIDKALCRGLLQTSDEVIKPIIKNSLLKVYNHITSDEILHVKHYQVRGVGRYYPEKGVSFVQQSKKIKHTLFKYMGWLDWDMKKGHPTIAYEVFKLAGIDLPNIRNFIDNFQSIADELIEYYSVEGKTPVSADQIKWIFNMMLYGGGFTKWVENITEGDVEYPPVMLKNIDNKYPNGRVIPHPIIKAFKKEADMVIDAIFKNNKRLLKKISKEEDGLTEYQQKNRLASFFFQIIENHILYIVYQFLIDRRFIIKGECELEFDGLCTPGVPFPYNEEEIISQLNSEILDKTGMDIPFKLKSYDTEFVQQDVIDELIANPPTGCIPVAEVVEAQVMEVIETECVNTITTGLYADVKTKFEETRFKVMNPIMFVEETNNGLEISKRADFKTKYENLSYKKLSKYDEEGNPVYIERCFIDEWFKDARNRTYDRMDFLPQQEAPPGVYNTFKGFRGETQPVIPDADFEQSLIFEHIKNLCGRNDAMFDYTMKVLARKVQEPHKLTNTALIFKSDEGAGKNMFFDYFGNQILGSEYYLATEKAELIFGRFNSAIEKKILVVLDEANGKDTFAINENIKNGITTTVNYIEKKGLPVYKETNHIQFIFPTNNDFPVKTPFGDRRFTGVVCNNEICNDAEYFNKLNDEMYSGRYDRAFYDYLMAMDVKTYNFTKNRVITDFYKDMQEINTPVIALFLYNKICEYNGGEMCYKSTALFNEFKEFVSSRSFRVEITHTRFGLDLKKYKGVVKKKSGGGIKVRLYIAELKKYLEDTYKINMGYEEEDVSECRINIDEVDDEEDVEII